MRSFSEILSEHPKETGGRRGTTRRVAPRFVAGLIRSGAYTAPSSASISRITDKIPQRHKTSDSGALKPRNLNEFFGVGGGLELPDPSRQRAATAGNTWQPAATPTGRILSLPLVAAKYRWLPLANHLQCDTPRQATGVVLAPTHIVQDRPDPTGSQLRLPSDQARFPGQRPRPSFRHPQARRSS